MYARGFRGVAGRVGGCFLPCVLGSNRCVRACGRAGERKEWLVESQRVGKESEERSRR